jgi:hypothetical protein
VVLLRRRGQLDPLTVLPLFFRLFRCRDKALRQELFSHIVAGERVGVLGKSNGFSIRAGPKQVIRSEGNVILR